MGRPGRAPWGRRCAPELSPGSFRRQRRGNAPFVSVAGRPVFKVLRAVSQRMPSPPRPRFQQISPRHAAQQELVPVRLWRSALLSFHSASCAASRGETFPRNHQQENDTMTQEKRHHKSAGRPAASRRSKPSRKCQAAPTTLSGASRSPRRARRYRSNERRRSSAMAESCCNQRPEQCRACGGDLGREYHFYAGACYCPSCWREIGRTRTSTPPAQQTLRLGELAQPQGVIHGH